MLLERSGDAIQMLDGEDLRIVECNEATVTMLRARSKAEVLAISPDRLSPERQLDGALSAVKAREMARRVQRRGSYRFEWVHRRMDGTDFPVEVLGTSTELGGRMFFLTVWRDITERKQMEHALRESENKFRLLFERSADPMLLLDLETWKFLDCNAASLELMRCSREELLHMTPWQVSPEIQPDGERSEAKAQSKLRSLLERGSARFEWTHRRRDGSQFPVEITLTSIKELEQQPLALVVWRESSERKRAEAEIRELNASLERRVAERTAELSAAQEVLRRGEERFRLSFEHTADSIILMDVETSAFVEANEAAVRFFGARNMTQLLSSQPWDVSPERQPDGRLSSNAARANINKVIELGAHRFEWMHRRFDGTDFPAEVSLTIVQFSDRPLMVAVLRDITERKLAEAELLRNLAKQKELSELKSSFVSMVSHEFRTPLAVILSCAELLKNHLDRLPEITRQQQLRAICESTQHMSRMIDEVLLLGKVEGGQMTFAPAPVDLAELCTRLVDEMHSATQHRCPIEYHAEPFGASALGDEALLRHILGNLLSNAVKYSPAGAAVRLEIQRDGAQAILRVSDRGAGIPSEDLPKIFTAFQRASNVGQIAGTGLGLVIVKRCVELHGGDISLQSTLGEGTVATVRLPLFATVAPTKKRPRVARAK